jgi:hypothetical protein
VRRLSLPGELAVWKVGHQMYRQTILALRNTLGSALTHALVAAEVRDETPLVTAAEVRGQKRD